MPAGLVLRCKHCRRVVTRPGAHEASPKPRISFGGFDVRRDSLTEVKLREGTKSWAPFEKDTFTGTLIDCAESHYLGAFADPDNRDLAELDEDDVFESPTCDVFHCIECDIALTLPIALLADRARLREDNDHSMVPEGFYCIGVKPGEPEIVVACDDIEFVNGKLEPSCCGPIGEVRCPNGHSIGSMFLDHWAPNFIKLDPARVRKK